MPRCESSRSFTTLPDRSIAEKQGSANPVSWDCDEQFSINRCGFHHVIRNIRAVWGFDVFSHAFFNDFATSFLGGAEN
ncbi:hypothetical protein GT625_01700 [Burkholderia thailandensis]|uniref:hypothetical protein n=1 Tax=Burkholderia thailandensis TaxID=57975 RepID=UPI001376BC16|nr:hypothetical protein [Burkholderia thailandensis]NBJ17464.1 hypothetical protein [Burkholderia thailandensis]